MIKSENTQNVIDKPRNFPKKLFKKFAGGHPCAADKEGLQEFSKTVGF